jgi:hypothetical protein
MMVPPRAMALGVPAKIRENAVAENMIAQNAVEYVRNGERFRAELRRLD